MEDEWLNNTQPDIYTDNKSQQSLENIYFFTIHSADALLLMRHDFYTAPEHLAGRSVVPNSKQQVQEIPHGVQTTELKSSVCENRHQTYQLTHGNRKRVHWQAVNRDISSHILAEEVKFGRDGGTAAAGHRRIRCLAERLFLQRWPIYRALLKCYIWINTEGSGDFCWFKGLGFLKIKNEKEKRKEEKVETEPKHQNTSMSHLIVAALSSVCHETLRSRRF